MAVNVVEAFEELPERSISLDQLPDAVPAEVVEVHSSVAGITPSTLRRLAELGFIPGERVQIVARVPGGTPLAVRIGTSTFALRLHEARCIRVSAMPAARS